VSEYLSTDKILSSVQEESLYFHYFGIDVSKKKCKSLIRADDSNASMKFRRINNRIKWSDFGSTYRDADIFDLLYISKGWSFYESLIHINNDFNLGFKYSDKYNIDIVASNPVNTDFLIPSLKENESIDIQVVLNKFNNKHVFTKDDLKYWIQGYINKTILMKEHVFSVNTVLLNSVPIMRYHKKDPIFLYVEMVDNIKFYKIYRPLHIGKQGKWLSNIQNASKAIGGLKHLQDTNYIIITKSKKDYMVLRWVLGYNVVYIQSESTPIDVDIMSMLWNKYETIYSLFDNDDAGYTLNEKFAEVNETIPIFYNTNDGKDSWDVILKYGMEKTRTIINKLMI
jgi:hypothetical protein